MAVFVSATLPIQASYAADSVWSSVGGGVTPGNVLALHTSGSDLYVGGGLTQAGGVFASKIAKWNGSTWSALGTGVNNNVNAIGSVGSNIYAGGFFTTAGGITANRIAKWDGTSWTALGGGVNSSVNAIATSGSSVYVGGGFSTVDGVTSTNYVAKWDDSTSTWSSLGAGANNGVNGNVYAIAASGSDVYVGGGFTTAGGSSASRIAKWNGTTWTSLGTGINGEVNAIAVLGSDIYVGGNFTTAGGVSVNYIAKWDTVTSTWSSLGSGVDSKVTAISVSGSNLYVAGAFTSAGGVTVNGIAKWDGLTWHNLRSGLFGTAYAVSLVGSEVYVAGSFGSASNESGKTFANTAYLARYAFDNTGPTLTNTSASDITTTSATINFTSDEVGTYYYLLYASSSPAPSATTVVAQGTAIKKGTSSFTTSPTSVSISALTAGTEYKAYVVVRDVAQNTSTVAAISFTTTDTTAPVLSTPTTGSTTATGTSLNFNSGEAGTYYYLVYAAADAAPANSATVVAQGTAVQKGSGNAVAGSNSVAVSGLAASTAYKAYLVVRDSSGNNSSISTFTFTTGAAPANQAVFIPAYRLSYFGNATDVSSLPYESNPYLEGEKIAVSQKLPARTGHTFANWNTSSNGSGKTYLPGDTILVGSKDIDLYAQWKVNSYTLSFSANGGSSMNLSAVTQEYLTTMKVPQLPDSSLRTGYTFTGWNTRADASGKPYLPGESYVFSADTQSLFAQWKINSYSITFDGNGSKFNRAPASIKQPFGTAVALASSIRPMTRSGYTFGGWNTEQNGTGATYKEGATVTIPAFDRTLYALWVPNTYVVRFFSAFSPQLPNGNFVAGGAVLSAPILSERKGYTFKGWSNKPNKETVIAFPYRPGVNRNISLYAVWVKD